jgi:hypothetical protein
MKLTQKQLRVLIAEAIQHRPAGSPEPIIEAPGQEPTPQDRLLSLLQEAAEVLMNAQLLCETEDELKELQHSVSQAENVVNVIITDLTDEINGTW